MDGVGLHMPGRVGVVNPVFLQMIEIHVVVEVGRIGPGEVFEEFDWQVDRDTMLDAGLGMVAHKVFGPLAKILGETTEEHRVNVVEIDLTVHGIADVHLLIPVFLTHLADFFQRIETVDGHGQLGQ